MQTTMLVVDDDVDIVIWVVAEAKARGYQATGTIDPRDLPMRVLEYRPDVVILDLEMGRHDGRDLLSRIKANAETASTVVIMISGTIDLHTISLCREYGAADFVPKPFVLDDLFGRIARALRTRPRPNPEPSNRGSG
jgi:two-component system alkaline phosphatase synthesis response regulator PhoP